MDMKITFTAQRRDDSLAIAKDVDALVINGLRFNFEAMAEGDMLPAHAVGTEWLAGPVVRAGGVLGLSLIWPHGSGEYVAPGPITVTADGPIAFASAGAPYAGVTPGAVDMARVVSANKVLADRRDAVWERIKAERTRRENGGVTAGGHWFQTDSDSRIKMLRLESKAVAALAAGGAATDVLTVAGQPINWKTTENGLVPMTVSLAQGIMTGIEVLDALAYTNAEVLRAQVMASAEPEAINITTGWPLVYGG